MNPYPGRTNLPLISALLAVWLFVFIFYFYGDTYNRITWEDSVVEYLSALFLLLTSLFLLGSGYFGRHKEARTILLLAALMFFFAAGEEISWGQRIFGFVTSEAWRDINLQEETNLHNINKPLFDQAMIKGTVLFVVFTSIWTGLGKTRIFTIPLPSIAVISCFTLAITYRYNEVFWYKALLLVFLAHGVLLYHSARTRRWGSFGASILTLATVILVNNVHLNNLEIFASANRPKEVMEFLFSFAAMSYALSMLLHFSANTQGDIKKV
jgi:hypothetical protein